jgi:hypothetical protein
MGVRMGLVGVTSPGKAEPKILTGWKDIARYLGMSVRSLQRYEHTCGLPVRRPSPSLRGAVMATTEELDRWLRRESAPKNNQGGPARFATASVASLLAGVERMEQLCNEIEQSRAMLQGSISTLRLTVSRGPLLRRVG